MGEFRLGNAWGVVHLGTGGRVGVSLSNSTNKAPWLSKELWCGGVRAEAEVPSSSPGEPRGC